MRACPDRRRRQAGGGTPNRQSYAPHAVPGIGLECKPVAELMTTCGATGSVQTTICRTHTAKASPCGVSSGDGTATQLEHRHG
ncbi:hypothetical protein THIARS_70175 [Thiomonas delicata]|uniref:Uncharacterized protein n=1 Tax=Thiomonas delicata TaxID=364030 RepID=A0A238D5P3_THIDL|nr:hypothetical protein THIARS_70175 [Thiomonas delicata]